MSFLEDQLHVTQIEATNDWTMKRFTDSHPLGAQIHHAKYNLYILKIRIRMKLYRKPITIKTS